MELGRETDLEQHVFHHVATQGLRHAQLLLLGRLERKVLVGVAEQHIVEAPLRRSEHARHAHLATQGNIGQAHTTAGSITGGPRFARTGVGRMAVGTQRLAVDEGVGQGAQHLLTVGPHQPGAHGGGGHLDQYHVVEANTVEGIFQRQHALDLVSHDHGFEHIAHQQWCFTCGHALLRQVIGNRQDAAEVIRWVGPLGGQPGIVVIQPAHRAADVPGGLDGVQAVGGAGDAGAVGHQGAFHLGAEQLGAFGEAQGQQAAAEGIHQAVARGVQGFGGFDPVREGVIGEGLQHPVVVRAGVEVYVGAHIQLPSELPGLLCSPSRHKAAPTGTAQTV
ncbi:hypothetical protein D3C75_727660 [compost metagenome]